MGVATQAGEQAFDKAMGSGLAHYGASTPQPQGACTIECNSRTTYHSIFCTSVAWMIKPAYSQ